VLRAANKLGAVLLQFPFSFHRTAETMTTLCPIKRLRGLSPGRRSTPRSWDSPETLELLRNHGVSFCNIDQPMIGDRLGPPAKPTSAVGYVRLHGRRYDTWSRTTNHPAQERYNYLYTAEELAPGSRGPQSHGSAPAKRLSSPTIIFRAKPWSTLQLISILKARK